VSGSQPDTAAALESDHALLCAAARAGGAIAKRYFGGPFDVREKSPGDPVTEADLAVDAEIKRLILGERPEDAWLSEETADSPARLDARRVWIVDPIDGTKAFVAGRPEFAVSIALVENGRPIAAAIFNPITDEFIDAVRNGGTRCNGQRVQVTEESDTAALVLGTSHNELRRKLWRHLFPESEVEPVDAIAYKLGLLAAGRFDGVIALRPKSDWDIAAGDLLVHEAGGRMTDADGNVLRYNRAEIRHPNLVASGPAIHSALLARLRDR
jgi:myo-inositol-1(or 4)-monophosphatase